MTIHLSPASLILYLLSINIQYYFSFDDTFEQVTSSTENFSKQEGRTESGMLPLDQPYSDSVERVELIISPFISVLITINVDNLFLDEKKT